MLVPHRPHGHRRQRQGRPGLVPRHERRRSTSTIRSTRRSTTRSTSTSSTRPRGRVPGSPSSSAPSRPAGSSRASTRRSPPRGPPPLDVAARSGGRRPPAVGAGADAVKAWAAAVGGGAPGDGARPSRRVLAGGHGACSTAPHGAIFVKAVGAELNADSPDLHRREAVVSAALPTSPSFPRLLDSFDDGAWVAPAFEAIDGRPPRHPWDPGELRGRARRPGSGARSAHAEPDGPHRAGRGALRAPLFGGWSELAAAGAPAELDPWARRPSGLAELEASWPAAIAGLDARPRRHPLRQHDLGPGAVPSSSTGRTPPSAHPSFDLVAWAPSVVLEGGPPPEDLARRATGLQRDADPEILTTLLAAVTGFFVSHSLRPPPPGLPTLRPFQAAQGEVALGLAAPADGLVTADAPTSRCAIACRHALRTADPQLHNRRARRALR